ncbi:MAG TPA: hypothetical protein VMM13_12565, partial [Euzebya sp.]|nr:hypothetical protein [Euzebya sp.]
VLTALVAAALLVSYLGYQIAVVGITGSGRSNNSPPSLLLACHAIAYTGVALALGPRLEGALAATWRRRQLLAAASAWSMPVYLWHMTGLVAIVGLELVADVPGVTQLLAIDPLTAAWWAARPLWLVAALAPTLLLIVLTRRPSLWLVGRSQAVAPPAPVAVVVAIAACSAGIGLLATGSSVGLPAALVAVGVLAMHLPALRRTPVTGSLASGL